MDIKIQLKKLIQTAELYRSQGLLFEATGKYEDALTLLQGSELMEGNQKLADIISKKISAVKNDIKKIEKQPILPEVSREQQDIIKNLFTESKDTSKESDVLEGALTLAKFGQFERSLEELNELLKAPHLRMKAAKNILRCHMARASIEDAYSQFQKWQSSNLFSPNQLITIRLFLEVFRFDNLKENVSLQLRDPEHVDELEITDGEFPDICSMIITFDDGPLKGGTFVLDVSFQTGNVITLFVAGHKEELLDNFKVGKILKNLQFNTTIAIFKGKGIVDEKIKFDSGSRQGDYRLDIKVTSS
jgi:tetratricopeptide (TPR) repeat protein